MRASDRPLTKLMKASTAQPSAAPAEDAEATAGASSAYFAKLKIDISRKYPQPVNLVSSQALASLEQQRYALTHILSLNIIKSPGSVRCTNAKLPMVSNWPNVTPENC